VLGPESEGQHGITPYYALQLIHTACQHSVCHADEGSIAAVNQRLVFKNRRREALDEQTSQINWRGEMKKEREVDFRLKQSSFFNR